MNILNYAKSVEPCQRNWDEDFIIPQDHIDYIINVCTTMPTKQNVNAYTLIVVTDRKVINNLFLSAYEPEIEETHKGNGQVRANCVFLWINGEEEVHLTNDLYINIGISSGAAALAAAELGYKTGFCKCFQKPEIISAIENYYEPIKEKRPLLMLGFGIPNENFPRTMCVDNNVPIRNKPSKGKKDIKIIKI